MDSVLDLDPQEIKQIKQVFTNNKDLYLSTAP